MRLNIESLIPVTIALACACTLEPVGADEGDFGSAGATPSTTSPAAGDTGDPAAASSSTTDETTSGEAPQGETTDDGSDTDGSAATTGGDPGGTSLPPTASGGLPTGGAANGCYGHTDQASCEADGCEWASLGGGTALCADPGVLGTGGLDGFDGFCDGLDEATCGLLGCVWDGSVCTSDAGSTGSTGGGATE